MNTPIVASTPANAAQPPVTAQPAAESNKAPGAGSPRSGATAAVPAGASQVVGNERALQHVAGGAARPAPYSRVIVIDSMSIDADAVSVSPTAKLDMVPHGVFVRAILNAGINGGKVSGDAGHLPIEAVPLNDKFDEAAALRSILASAPRDSAGQASLRGVAINLSRTWFGGPGLTPEEARVFEDVLRAGADLYVSESNINHGFPNDMLQVRDIPGGGRLIGVGSSDAKIFRNPDSTQPSAQNPWYSFSRPHTIDQVGNGDVSITAIDSNRDGITDGYDLNGDRIADFDAADVTPDTRAIERPFVGRPAAPLLVSDKELLALEHKAIARVEALRAREPNPQKVEYGRDMEIISQVRGEMAASLAGRLVSVDSVNALNLEDDRSTRTTVLLGSLFRIDQHTPRHAELDPRKLYVNADALARGDWEGHYRDMVFFTEAKDGSVIKVPDLPGTVGHAPTANSWAAPYAAVREQLARLQEAGGTPR
jgi:hypothetical protein